MARLSGPGKCLSWGWLFHWCLYQISPGLVIRRQCSIFNTLVFSLYPGWLGIETSCWEWGASTMTLDIFFLNLHFFHFWYRISRCCANGWWTRSRWGTRHQGLDMLARSGALPVVVSSSTLWRSIQGMYWWSAWWLKVSASAFGDFFYQLSRYKNPRRSPGFPQWMCWGWKEWEDCPLSLCEWDGLQGCEIVSPGSPAERSKPLKTHGHVVEHVGGRGGERWLKSFCNLEMFTSIWTIYDEKLHWLLPFGNCKVFHTSLVCRVVLKVVSVSYPPRVEFQWYNKSGTLEFYQNLLYNEIWTSFYIPKYQVTNWMLVTQCCFKVSKSPF